MIKLPKLWTPRSRVQRYKHFRERRGSWWWCCCGETPPPPTCIYFTDDFASGTIDPTKWVNTSGAWSVVSGVARTTATDSLLQSVSTTGSLGGSSIVNVRSSGFNVAVVYSREIVIQGTTHVGVGAELDFAQNKVRLVAPGPLGGGIKLAECPYELSFNTFYTVRVCHHRIVDTAGGQEVYRGLVSLFIDDVLVLRAYDTGCSGWFLETGEDPVFFRIGIGTGEVEPGTYVEFDNALATRLDPDGDAKCHECGVCCWPYTMDPPNTITTQLLGIGSDLNPCLTTANLCNNLTNASFQLTKTNYPYVEDINDPNVLIYFPCAYYTLGGLNFVCDDRVYNRISMLAGVLHSCSGGQAAPTTSCRLDWRLWSDEGDTFYGSPAFIDYLRVVTWEAVFPLPTDSLLDELCGDFPLDLLPGPTTDATCLTPGSVLRITTP